MRKDLKRLMGKCSNTTEERRKKQMNLNLFAQDNLQSMWYLKIQERRMENKKENRLKKFYKNAVKFL